MFLVRRPSAEAIARFLQRSEDVPLSYQHAGIVRSPNPAQEVREWTYAIGRGSGDFERARDAIAQWKHFELGWVELFPRPAPVVAGRWLRY